MSMTARLARLTAAAATTLALTATSWSSEVLTLDPDLPEYTPVPGISGNLNSIGSDTLNNLMLMWADGFRAIYPNVNIQVQGAGSSTAPAALIDGTAQIGPMSRPMTGVEIDRFEARYGYPPTEVRVGIDALAVFVHRDNPIKGLNLQQVDGIFSSTFRLGGSPILTWGQAGLEGDWANRPISLYGRNSVSGTYGFFKNIALGGGDFDGNRYQEQPGSSTVVQSVTADRFGIGYSGIGYRTSGVRAIALATSDSEELFEPTPENCISGDYPLARFLFVYVNKNPREPMDPLTFEFIRFINSRQGQEVVIRDNFFPLPAVVAEETVNMLK
ncbi:MAG TPA: phosphate ABC transporter substrate-binding protein [Kiritimatiellia bacterium]|nr:phosphate ABC transporter substrate-binding protein [Kiritimatiellia bacterium]